MDCVKMRWSIGMLEKSGLMDEIQAITRVRVCAEPDSINYSADTSCNGSFFSLDPNTFPEHERLASPPPYTNP